MAVCKVEGCTELLGSRLRGVAAGLVVEFQMSSFNKNPEFSFLSTALGDEPKTLALPQDNDEASPIISPDLPDLQVPQILPLPRNHFCFSTTPNTVPFDMGSLCMNSIAKRQFKLKNQSAVPATVRLSTSTFPLFDSDADILSEFTKETTQHNSSLLAARREDSLGLYFSVSPSKEFFLPPHDSQVIEVFVLGDAPGLYSELLQLQMDGVEPQFFAIEALVTGPLLQLDPNSKGLYSSLATNPTPSLPITDDGSNVLKWLPKTICPPLSRDVLADVTGSKHSRIEWRGVTPNTLAETKEIQVYNPTPFPVEASVAVVAIPSPLPEYTPSSPPQLPTLDDIEVESPVVPEEDMTQVTGRRKPMTAKDKEKEARLKLEQEQRLEEMQNQMMETKKEKLEELIRALTEEHQQKEAEALKEHRMNCFIATNPLQFQKSPNKVWTLSHQSITVQPFSFQRLEVQCNTLNLSGEQSTRQDAVSRFFESRLVILPRYLPTPCQQGPQDYAEALSVLAEIPSVLANPLGDDVIQKRAWHPTAVRLVSPPTIDVAMSVRVVEGGLEFQPTRLHFISNAAQPTAQQLSLTVSNRSPAILSSSFSIHPEASYPHAFSILSYRLITEHSNGNFSARKQSIYNNLHHNITRVTKQGSKSLTTTRKSDTALFGHSVRIKSGENLPPVPLEPSSSLEITIQFIPPSLPPPISSSVDLSNSLVTTLPSGEEMAIPISATVQFPKVVLSTNVIDFGTVHCTQSKTMVVTLCNPTNIHAEWAVAPSVPRPLSASIRSNENSWKSFNFSPNCGVLPSSNGKIPVKHAVKVTLTPGPAGPVEAEFLLDVVAGIRSSLTVKAERSMQEDLL